MYVLFCQALAPARHNFPHNLGRTSGDPCSNNTFPMATPLNDYPQSLNSNMITTLVSNSGNSSCAMATATTNGPSQHGRVEKASRVKSLWPRAKLPNSPGEGVEDFGSLSSCIILLQNFGKGVWDLKLEWTSLWKKQLTYVWNQPFPEKKPNWTFHFQSTNLWLLQQLHHHRTHRRIFTPSPGLLPIFPAGMTSITSTLTSVMSSLQVSTSAFARLSPVPRQESLSVPGMAPLKVLSCQCCTDYFMVVIYPHCVGHKLPIAIKLLMPWLMQCNTCGLWTNFCWQ